MKTLLTTALAIGLVLTVSLYFFQAGQEAQQVEMSEASQQETILVEDSFEKVEEDEVQIVEEIEPVDPELIAALQLELGALNERVDTFEKEVSELDGQFTALQVKVKHTTSDLASTKKQVSALQKQFRQLEMADKVVVDVNSPEFDALSLHQKVDNLKTAISNNEAFILDLQYQVTVAYAALEDLKVNAEENADRITKTKQSIESKSVKVAAYEEEVGSFYQRIAALEKEIETGVHPEAVAAREAMKTPANENASLEAREKLLREGEALFLELSSFKAEIALNQKSLKQLTPGLGTLENTHLALETDLEAQQSLFATIAEVNNPSVDEVKGQVSALTNRYANVSGKYNDLSSLYKTLGGRLNGQQDELGSIERSLDNLLSSLIELEPVKQWAMVQAYK